MSLRSWIVQASCAAAALGVAAPSAYAAPRETVLLSFGGSNGIAPEAGVVFDSQGNLYGTTSYGGQYNRGTAYKLAPPAPGETHWTQTLLHSFGASAADGVTPNTTLSLDAAGNLYGTTPGNYASNGTVFMIKPPAAGQALWHTQTLLSFGVYGGTTFSIPTPGITVDAAGNLYGATAGGGTYGNGTVYELTPSPDGSVPWPKTILYSFGCCSEQPAGNPIFDAAGNLYGAGYNLVYKLSPPRGGATTWTETTLYVFGPPPDGAGVQGALTFDAVGNLYGTTQNGGVGNSGIAFRLTPPAGGVGAWTETVLHTFTNTGTEGGYPNSGVALDGAGNVYGTTMNGGIVGNGTVFQLTPPINGTGMWTEHTIYAFTRSLGLGGRTPAGGLAIDATGILYGTASQGGRGACSTGCGTVFQLQP